MPFDFSLTCDLALRRMLEGKSAIVTGSTSGIGLSVAGKLASQGANVTINGFGKKSEIDEIVSKVRTSTSRQRDDISLLRALDRSLKGIRCKN